MKVFNMEISCENLYKKKSMNGNSKIFISNWN